MAHFGQETTGRKWLHGGVPVLISLIAVAFSCYLDRIHFDVMSQPQSPPWTARSGAIVALCGAYSAFVGSIRTLRREQGINIVNFDLPYPWIGFALLGIGTILWAYGDKWL
jgi:hypothetical protein